MAITKDDFRKINFQSVQYIDEKGKNINTQLVDNVNNSLTAFFDNPSFKSIMHVSINIGDLVDNNLGGPLNSLVSSQSNYLLEKYTQVLDDLYARELSVGSIEQYIADCENNQIGSIENNVTVIKEKFMNELKRNVMGMNESILNNIQKYMDNVINKYNEKYSEVINNSFRPRRNLADELINDINKSREVEVNGSNKSLGNIESLKNTINIEQEKNIQKSDEVIKYGNVSNINIPKDINENVNVSLGGIDFTKMSNNEIDDLMEYLNGIKVSRNIEEETVIEEKDEVQSLPGNILL